MIFIFLACIKRLYEEKQMFPDYKNYVSYNILDKIGFHLNFWDRDCHEYWLKFTSSVQYLTE